MESQSLCCFRFNWFQTAVGLITGIKTGISPTSLLCDSAGYRYSKVKEEHFWIFIVMSEPNIDLIDDKVFA